MFCALYTRKSHLSVEHAGKAHQEYLEHASLEQSDLVVLRQERKTRNALREFYNTTDGW
jgi:hypothetical protein